MTSVYLRYPGYPMTEQVRHWTGHGAKWAWWCIWDILKGLGCNVAYGAYADKPPDRVFDLVVSMQDLHGLEDIIGDHTKTIVRLTSANPLFNNAQVTKRTDQVNLRRGSHIPPRRLMQIHEDHFRWLEISDILILNGKQYIKETFPEKYWHKMVIMDNIAGNINRKVEMRTQIPKARHWLWHAGSGAIHKGLDLCLEVFARHPEWTLHVTGNLRAEQDFLQEYSYELNLPNIHFHGWTLVDSPQFKAIVDRCVGFILPTCAESQSAAAATCLTLGLYPIISKASGIDLPEGAGMYLDDLTIDAVEMAVELAMSFDDERLLEKITIIQSDALVRYSRETFRNKMTALLKEALNA